MPPRSVREEARVVLYQETRWYIKTTKSQSVLNNNFNYYTSKLTPQALFSFLSPLGTSLVAGLTLSESITALRVTTFNFSYALPGDLFAEFHGLPDDLIRELLARLEQFKDQISDELYDKVRSAILGPLSYLESVFDEIADVLKQIAEDLLSAIQTILDFRKLYNEIVSLLERLVETLLSLVLGKNVSDSHLQKGRYGESQLGRFYYDPQDLINLLMNVTSYDLAQGKFTLRLKELQPYLEDVNPSLVVSRATANTDLYQVLNSFMMWDSGQWDVGYWMGDGIPVLTARYGTAILDAHTLDAQPPLQDIDQPGPYYIVPVAPDQLPYYEADTSYIPSYTYDPETATEIPFATQIEDLHDAINVLKWDEGIWDGGYWGEEDQPYLDTWAYNPYYDETHLQLIADGYVGYYKTSLLRQDYMWQTQEPIVTTGVPQAQISTKLWATSKIQTDSIIKDTASLLSQKGITSPYETNQYANALKEYYRALSGSRNAKDSFTTTPGVSDVKSKLITKYTSLGLDPEVLQDLFSALEDKVKRYATIKYRDTTRAKLYKKILRKYVWDFNA